MEILQLRYFFESANNQSFSKTAEKYKVPLSSVSASVKRLEQELGSPLFNRFSNKIELNENGRKLQNSLCIIFDELNRVTEQISTKNANEDNREINICVQVLRRDITDFIIKYKTTHPNISFRTIFDFTGDEPEEFDIIVDDDPSKYPEYEQFAIFSKKIGLKVAADSPLCDKELCLKQLCKQPFISYGEHSNMHKLLVRACLREGFTPHFVAQTNDLLCYAKYVEAGIGIGVARYDDGENMGNEKTKILNVTDFRERQTVYVFYKKTSAYGNVSDFLDFLWDNSTW